LSEKEYKKVDFEIEKEDWNYYRLSNGAILKMKTIVQEIFEHVGTEDPITGLPTYTVRSSNAISVTKEEE
jgi:hypothetical protein